MKTVLVIPARLKSTRLPNKPLAVIGDKTMIVHVWEKATQANVGPVIVAAAEQEIIDAIEAVGGKAYLTDPDLPSGTDRVKAAVDQFDPNGEYDVVINLQGDMPTIDPEVIASVLDAFKNPGVEISTLANLITDEDDLISPHTVKIAIHLEDQGGRALYFSRLPIPYGAPTHYHHIGIYGFRRASLNKFVSLPTCDLETVERLEQLRALCHGMHIHVRIVDTDAPFGVDTPEDLERARIFMVG